MTADEITTRLSDAGRVLVALPSASVISPARLEALPEIVRRALLARGTDRRYVKTAPLTLGDVERMVETFAWLDYVEVGRLQRVVMLRSLSRPLTGAPLHSWRRLGVMLGISGSTIGNWHRQAVGQIVDRLNALPPPGSRAHGAQL